MKSFRRIELAILLMASAILGGCLEGGTADTEATADEPTSEVASELAADCEGGRNGFIDIRDDLVGTLHPRPPVSIAAGVTASLEVGTVAGFQRGWAKLNGPTRPGDLVWMDWTQDRGRTWLQCGPFRVDRVGMSKTSAAKRTNPSPAWQFRACGRRMPADSVCGDWW